MQQTHFINVRKYAMTVLSAILIAGASASSGFGQPLKFETQEISARVGNVCYAVIAADVNNDKHPDIVAVTEDAVVWFAYPDWKAHDIVRGKTERDNVCIQAADVNGDGLTDFVLGAAWRPTDTRAGGTLQWLRQVAPTSLNDNGLSGNDKIRWELLPVGSEPTMHRIRFGRYPTAADGKPQLHLVAAPLQGRGTKPPKWDEGNAVRLLSYAIPKNPEKDAWPATVLDESLHTVHNLQVVDFDGDQREDILLAAWEGVFLLKQDPKEPKRWVKTKLGSGNQTATPFKGASEIKLGRKADGQPFLATIEPWHGFETVIYTPPAPTKEPLSGENLWTRRVLDDTFTAGHAVWCADLNGDGGDELIVGHRERRTKPRDGKNGPGIVIWNIGKDTQTPTFLDDGGVAVEDLIAEDLNGDQRPEIIAGGRATHNVRIYWNRTGATGGK